MPLDRLWVGTTGFTQPFRNALQSRRGGPPGWTVLGSSEPVVDLLSSGQAGTRQTDTRAAAGTQVPHSAPSADSSGQSSLRFGRTTVQVICGDVFCTDAEAIVCPANRRGMMVAGAAGLVRLRGGAEIEREIMSQAPLTLGTSIATTSGELESRGIRMVFHAVVFDDLGGATRIDHVERAITSTLQSVERHRVRSIVIPPVGSGVGTGRLTQRDVYNVIVDELAGHLRRFTSRIEMVTIACPDNRDIRHTFALLQQAYQVWLELQAT